MFEDVINYAERVQMTEKLIEDSFGAGAEEIIQRAKKRATETPKSYLDCLRLEMQVENARELARACRERAKAERRKLVNLWTVCIVMWGCSSAIWMIAACASVEHGGIGFWLSVLGCVCCAGAMIWTIHRRRKNKLALEKLEAEETEKAG